MTQTREQLLATIRERMVAYASSHLGRDFAEDMAQETLLVLEQKYGDKDRPEDLLPIAFQVLRFKLTEFRRKATRRGEWDTQPVDELPLADGRADQAVDLERRELQARLEEAIAKLDGRCRDLFRLKLEDKTFEEIRQEMGAAAINTVYTWDHRCRQRLLELMGGQWRKKEVSK
ncbi:MAG TPA: sigma-70 family RNA polymerase sigma factor [Bryobacteraceae bacterium]|nr:sigma-70 family RNA polymerase sigma factor [Bryobacteraceae bacterium]